MNPQSFTREKTEIMGLLRQNKERGKHYLISAFFWENIVKKMKKVYTINI